ncbi:bifunctional UDP-N-acetylmuramoyl-tripeptide:D-alanyl-D-alanine ligase/alanine racemase [Flammeovirgaceae bacterium SG7u.111]|nr:bifunctional UDP-N-acetylmuramoyl-tripeptide:D-alanyl-D-alanine ligase/alanine racemase [Flammeovirgaceae bacterium SG7u.132]WPO38641.1 bifunctional UDP-N-acetylmuramoyl-tripeptide:D-alanyl-D-alanine ligase/alanine racemase [Flammeovirgaceae bacterium SG7u.111]
MNLLQKRYLLTDSRKLISPSESVFFAIDGERHDGHQFIKNLYEKGVREFVVEKELDTETEQLDGIHFYKTESSVGFLQEQASLKRQQFVIPVIGITGSNGKTIVKEWLYQMISPYFSIVKSPKSYNSQIGVPLSVWEMNEHHTLGIFEAGISQVGEMGKLEKVIRPSFGIFTNLGTAHDEGFENQVQKLEEKLALFQQSETLLVSADQDEVVEAAKKLPCNLLSWSAKGKKADIQFEINEPKKLIEARFEEKTTQVFLPFTDAASLENYFHCIATMLYLGMSENQIKAAVSRINPIPMRLSLKRGINDCLLIDDTYNNDLAGLSTALDFLQQQQGKEKRTLILSDFVDARGSKEELYKSVAKQLVSRKIERVIGIGKDMRAYWTLFNDLDYQSFENTAAFFADKRVKFEKEVILIKGARKFSFEKIVAQLEEKVHGTRLEINLETLANNLNLIRSKLDSNTKIMAMVKAFAYGSGSFEIAQLLQYHLVDYLAVAYADEGVALRKQGITMPIMVMNPSKETFPYLLRHKLEPEIYSFSQLRSFIYFLRKFPSYPPVKIHIILDTGMRRLGFESHEIKELANILEQNGDVRVKSIFSHLAAADDPEHETFTRQQIFLFDKLSSELSNQLGYQPIRHILNSAGILNYPDRQFDMVRLGIGLYGIDPRSNPELELHNAATLKTSISQIKEIKKGESVGYGRAFIAAKAMKIATIAIGYADGYDRRFGKGNGKVLVKGKLAPVIGNVCMDMCMIDVSGIEDVSEGEEVIVFGANPSVVELAQAIGTIPYELLTNVSERVKRVFYTE